MFSAERSEIWAAVRAHFIAAGICLSDEIEATNDPANVSPQPET